jgi:integration host factor subunit alpha
MALRKKELADLLYEELEFSKKECAPIVESFFEVIKDELAKGNDVMISGFGKWSVNKKNARVVRNPKTGEKITLDARKVVTFRGGEKLRSALNHGSYKIKGG